MWTQTRGRYSGVVVAGLGVHVEVVVGDMVVGAPACLVLATAEAVGAEVHPWRACLVPSASWMMTTVVAMAAPMVAVAVAGMGGVGVEVVAATAALPMVGQCATGAKDPDMTPLHAPTPLVGGRIAATMSVVLCPVATSPRRPPPPLFSKCTYIHRDKRGLACIVGGHRTWGKNVH